MTLEGYMNYLGWSIAEMARQAGMNTRTVTRALNGEMVRPQTARKLAQGLEKGMGKRVFPGDIEGLIIERP